AAWRVSAARPPSGSRWACTTVAGFTRSSAARCRTEGSAAPGRSSPAAIATRKRFAIWAYSGLGLRGSSCSNTGLHVYYCYDTVIQTSGPVNPGRSQTSGPYSASCLFSKTLNVMGEVVDVATDHLAALFAEHAKAHPDREFLVFGSRRMSYAP